MPDKPHTHTITDNIPHDEIRAEFSVMDRSIRLARERGVFPASWYPGMKRLCELHGVDCPMDAFNWKSSTSDAPEGADAIKRGHASATRQGQGPEKAAS